ncbi:MAG: hypothetical protein AAB296_02920, partial [Candidatus Desantisbacteria bacterium]
NNYIYVKAEDGAGNLSTAKTFGPFYIDTTAPWLNTGTVIGQSWTTNESQDFFTNSTSITIAGTAGDSLSALSDVVWGAWGNNYDYFWDDKNALGDNDGSFSANFTGISGFNRWHFDSRDNAGNYSNRWGESSYCDVFVDNASPNVPSAPAVTPSSTTQLDISWSIPLDKGAGTGAADGSSESLNETYNDGVEWYRVGDVGVYVNETTANSGASDQNWTASTSYSDTALSANTPYGYRVKGRDNNSQGRGAWNNESAYSSSTSKYTLVETPNVPTFGTVTSTSIVINASGSSNIASGSSGYYFDSVTAGGDGGINVWTQSTTGTATGLSPNTQYTFQVKGRNGNGVETSWSTSASRWTAPSIPSITSCTAQTDQPLNSELGKVVINWSGDASAYTLEYSNDQSNWNVLVNNQAVATYTHTGLNDNIIYYYRVKGRNNDNDWTDYSTTQSVFIPDRTKLSSPTLGAAEQNCIGYWSFDDSLVPGRDYGIYGYNATLGNQAAYTSAGYLTGAISLDGSDDSVDTGLKNANNTWTISAWFYPTNIISNAYIGTPVIDSDFPGYYGSGFGIEPSLFKVLYNNGWKQYNYTFTANKWYYAAVVFNREAGTVEAFVNGASLGSQAVTFSSPGASNLANFYIGKDPAN